MGVGFVDPTDAIRADEAAGRHLYLGYDPHMKAEGYRLMAELLLDAYRRDTASE